ncbi:mannose-1-phosphate guanylyltransferase/mannose-6-phosphate isomerase [Desulfovibrio ferrophilus]|uniref:mannose-1-phosphate guanylyltransferase n=1 Tax=Desulfovibrio ferrophilus TaxID=241368 RepID=A0A2Z6B1A6_9BACT|nr:mannose-1-phosphate guanylyltransferase/mannose-6-phosphate isomerase [Desulfovibrio ferrophilus]BBD09307.1 mannose-1-phosphate guanylyltransferase/mannose-6-phosphate isomerase [Desulfovibrio ferrophilus]
MLCPVILCGGKGSRLWPMSRELYPKQFMEFLPGATLFEATLDRMTALDPGCQPIVICNEAHRFLAAEQLRSKNITGRIVLEPTGRNTAPAAALAALMTQEDDPILVVMPADHRIPDTQAFAQAIAQAASAARQGDLVCLGIAARSPETGYGYLLKGESQGNDVFNVKAFVEKPDSNTARDYVESGQYLWNSGIFLFTASRYLKALETHCPDILKACRDAMESSAPDMDFIRPEREAFMNCPSNSIDYAVLEKEKNLKVVELDTAWSDLGAWEAVHENGEQDANGNVTVGDVVAQDSNGCYLHSTGRLVATVGLEKAVVVETPDAVLVTTMNAAQNVKGMIDELVRRHRPEALGHTTDYRPWGNFTNIIKGDQFKVKRIVVKPGASLSRQMHYHRAEHWVVVRGSAQVTNGDTELLLAESQSTYIPLGTVHRLTNPGKIDLELIEIQTGPYLEEDDIVRFEDIYGRLDT